MIPKAWHGGKGSIPRGDFEKYRSGYDLIFKKKEKSEIPTNPKKQKEGEK